MQLAPSIYAVDCYLCVFVSSSPSFFFFLARRVFPPLPLWCYVSQVAMLAAMRLCVWHCLWLCFLWWCFQ
ncbi:hypothetical protein BDA99DRAFT_491901 [Phascolomyces articulosus]|uniref:Uncharacterized protein n=1 Tax=Phascolomyces articulosus TaxID=60185 RepID=A0AAD5KPU9_9FUNG|nr:hypothetical protein BDA99DRAFT_491901 [Phascolomyces articulosus]